MVHQLKIEKKYYEKIILGEKTFEVRKNDRDFQAGDYLGLNEINENHEETGSFVLAKVLDVFSDKKFVKDGYVIMSIRPCFIKEVDWDYAPFYERKRLNSKK